MENLSLSTFLEGLGSVCLVLYLRRKNIVEERNCSLNARQELEKSQGTGVCGKKFKGIKLRGPTAPSLAPLPK